MIDLHCHVLHGIDDGAQTLDDAVALVRSAAAAGAHRMVATPHVSRRYPNDAQTIGLHVEELSSRLATEKIPVEICAGAEIAAAVAAEIECEQLAALRLGGGEWLLLEPPFAPNAPLLGSLVEGLQRQGHRIVLAHPERCHAFHRDPGLLEALVRAGALTSVTAGSLAGRFGGDARSFALDLAGARMLHNVASDAHDLVRRPPGMAAEILQAGLGGLADWLTQDVPAAILSGAEIPRRPSGAAPVDLRRGWRKLWRRAGASEHVSRWPLASF